MGLDDAWLVTDEAAAVNLLAVLLPAVFDQLDECESHHWADFLYSLRPGGTGADPPWLQRLCARWVSANDIRLQTLADAGPRLDLLHGRLAGEPTSAFRGSHHVSPSRVAQLAWQATQGGANAALANLTERLLHDTLTSAQPPQRADLQMAALLVSGQPPVGQKAQITFTRLGPDHGSVEPGAHLVRAPEFSTVWADEAFEQGVALVNRLLCRVLRPGSTAVVFSLALAGQAGMEAPALTSIAGPSVTTALAVGALWLLQDQVSDEFPDLQAAIDGLRPWQLVVTAGLADAAPMAHAPVGLAWPLLTVIGGFTAKAALYEAEFSDLRPYHAPDQPMLGFGAIAPGYQPPRDLLQLLQQMSSDTGIGLTAEQSMVHRWCTATSGSPVPPPDHACWHRAQATGGPPADLEAWLLQQVVAAHASPPAPPTSLRFAFAAPRPLQAQASPVRLRQDANGDQGPKLDLQHLFSDKPHAAWALSGPLLSGKSTLLATWALSMARVALRALSLRPGTDAGLPPAWLQPDEVEVCVHLDLHQVQWPMAADGIDPSGVPSALYNHLRRIAPWVSLAASDAALPKIGPMPRSGRMGYGNEGLRHHPVRLRLLLDGMDVFAGQTTTKATMVRLADWLAVQDQNTVLPCVFTVPEPQYLSKLERPGHLEVHHAQLLPWQQEDWRAFLGHLQGLPERKLADEAHAELSRRLGLAQNGPMLSPNQFQQFCALPGHLAAVCELLRLDPDAQHLPTTPGRMMLALLWHALVRAADDDLDADANAWLWGRTKKAGVLAYAQDGGWPAAPLSGCALVDQLVCLASTLGRSPGQGQVHIDTALAKFADEPTQNLARQTRWLDAAQALGLVTSNPLNDRLGFTQPLWQSLFLALSRHRPDADLQLQLKEAPGPQHDLSWLGNSPMLPLAPPVALEVRMAVDVADGPGRLAWLEHLIKDNLPLAAQVAIDQLPALQQQPEAAPWLDLLRALLLLRSVNAGAAAGLAVAQSPLLPDIDARLQQHGDTVWRLWQRARATSLVGPGRELPERLAAALLLGRLGDTLRYENAPLHDQGLQSAWRLRAEWWHEVQAPGKCFRVAAFTLTQGEWDSFLAHGQAFDPEAPCWHAAGTQAKQWLVRWRALRDTAQAGPTPAGMGLVAWRGEWANPLLPVTGVSWHAARAYVAWARRSGLYAHLRDRGWGEPDLPTEYEWHLAAHADGGPRSLGRAHDFNHLPLRWHRPAPVGVFSADWSLPGLADLRGNVRQWCGSAFNPDSLYSPIQPEVSDRCDPGTARLAAVRGSDYDTPPEHCGLAQASRVEASNSQIGLGLRLVLRPGADPRPQA